MVAQFRKYTNPLNPTLWVNCRVCELYHNEAVKGQDPVQFCGTQEVFQA